MPDPKDLDATPEVEPGKPAPDSGKDQQPVNWEARYKGLQTAYNKLEAKYNKLVGENETTVGELEELRMKQKDVDTEKKTLADKLVKADLEKGTLQQQLQGHQLQSERAKLIMKEFPDLGPFEGDGLLPSAATIEETRTKLEAFRKTWEATTGAKTRQTLQGSSPPGAGGGTLPARDKNTIYSELTRLAGSTDPESRKKYDDLMTEWLELNKPK